MATRAMGKLGSMPPRSGLGGRPPLVPSVAPISPHNAQVPNPANAVAMARRGRRVSSASPMSTAMAPNEPMNQTVETNHCSPSGTGTTELTRWISTVRSARTAATSTITSTTAVTTRTTSDARRRMDPSPIGVNTSDRQRRATATGRRTRGPRVIEGAPVTRSYEHTAWPPPRIRSRGCQFVR